MKTLSLEQMENVNGGKAWTLKDEIVCGGWNVLAIAALAIPFGIFASAAAILSAYDRGCYEPVTGIPY
jgi:hypothetical protein